MIRLMLSAVGVAIAGRNAGDDADLLTPEEQLRRFNEVCERLSPGDEVSEECREDE